MIDLPPGEPSSLLVEDCGTWARADAVGGSVWELEEEWADRAADGGRLAVAAKKSRPRRSPRLDRRPPHRRRADRLHCRS